MKTSIAVIALVLGVAACSQEPPAAFRADQVPSIEGEWVPVARTGAATFDLRTGSVQQTTNNDGDLIIMGIGRIRDSTDSTIHGEIWYSSAADCKEGRGTLLALEPTGTYKSETTFVFGLGSVAASIAEIICAAGMSSAKQSGTGQKVI